MVGSFETMEGLHQALDQNPGFGRAKYRCSLEGASVEIEAHV